MTLSGGPAAGVTRQPARAPVVLVALAVGLAFWSVLANGFVNYDDTIYVLDNAAVRRGLQLEGVRWAFSTFHADNWHPLTWLSHMLDVSLFGLAPAGHHATSLALHAAAAAALFAFLRSATGASAPSAAVALLWAVHPTRVESVAWVAERKDVLSGLLAFLALAAWTGYVRRPSPARYALFTALFALGLLAKPMLVTLPLLLLLLDVWPYQRIRGFVRERALEKLPLLLLSTGAALVTLLAQSHARAALGGLSLAARLSNAAIAIAQYLLQLAWPAHLSVLYPHPIGARAGLGVTCALALAALTCWTWLERRRRPWLLVGWLWFVVALIPVLGIVQVGLQARADRYTYLPTVGLLVAGVWSGVSWAERSRRHRVLAAVAVGLVALAATARTRWELRHWHDSVALFRHALEVTGPDNPMAQFGLAQALARAGRAPEAVAHFAAAVAQRPDFERALEGGAEALVRAGRVDEAADWYARLLQRQPRSASTAYNLGQLRVAQGNLDDATRLLRIATTIDPGIARARHDLGIALLLGGDADAGVEWLRQAARGRGAPAEWKTHFEEAEARRAGRPAPALARYLAESRLVLADGLARRGRRNEACAQLRAAEPEAAPDQLQRMRTLRDRSCAGDPA